MQKIKNKKAFTLIEIIVVIAIIGVGVISFTPQLIRNTVEQDDTVQFFNDLIAGAYKESLSMQQPVSIRGFKGSDNIINASGEKKEIPGVSAVNNIEINEHGSFSTEYEITVYPSGICDYFKIYFGENSYIESTPLIMKVSKHEAD